MKANLLFQVILFSVSLLICNKGFAQEKPSAIIKPQSKMVMSGDQYSAEIFLSQELPSDCKVEILNNDGGDENITIGTDRILFSSTSSSPGLCSFSGIIKYTDDNNNTVSQPFSDKYFVTNPKAVVVNKYLLLGIDNPLQVSMQGFPVHELKVETSNGTLTGANGSYNLVPDKAGECIITVKASLNEDKMVTDSLVFEVIGK